MIDPNHPFRLFLQGIYKQNTPEALAELEEWSGQIYGMKKTLRHKLKAKSRVPTRKVEKYPETQAEYFKTLQGIKPIKWRQLSVEEVIDKA